MIHYNSCVSSDCDCFLIDNTHEQLRKALRAVVELHKPDQYGDCAGCDNRCGCYEGDIMNLNKWETCPTIQVIERELG